MTQNPDSPDPKEARPDSADGGASAAEDPGTPGGATRKERVLHTRVPAVLEQELKHLAQSLRMPVSNVVRAILEDAVAAVDRVGRKAEGEVHRAANRLAEQRERLRTITGARSSEEEERGAGEEVTGEPDGTAAADHDEPAGVDELFEGVIGYQPLVLARSAVCARCGAVLAKGSEAFLGVRAVPGPPVLIGRECLPSEE